MLQARADGRIVFKGVVPKGTGVAPVSVFWESHEEHVIETEFFSPIDNDAAVVVDKLQSGVVTDRPRTRGLGALHELVAASASRRDRRASRAPAELVAEVREKWRTDRLDPEEQARIDDALADVDPTQLARTAHRTTTVHAILDPNALHEIKSLAWDVIMVDTDHPFITTGRHVHVNLGQPRPRLELMTMPLSPTKLFVASRSHGATLGTGIDGVQQVLEAVTFGHYLMLLNEQRCRFAYASSCLKMS